MPDRFPEGGQWRSPQDLPPHLRRLHGRIQRDVGKERTERLGIVESDLDEDGRAWPGRVNEEE